MNSIKSTFTIKDLEHLSGILAHTIRIWEKRYAILEPERTTGNIRWYSVSDLRKLLNVSTLYRQGYKISKIASFSEERLLQEIRKMELEAAPHKWQSDLSLSMLTFDKALFDRTYTSMVEHMGLEASFEQMLIPFLHHVGIMWQTEAIVPAHEHFLSNLIRQKLMVAAEHLPADRDEEIAYVLFLPINEIHELGLLYIHYLLQKAGKASIYLGQSVPLEDIRLLEESFDRIRFISYFTVQPNADTADDYVQKIRENVLGGGLNEFWYLGKNAVHCQALESNKRTRHFSDVLAVKEAILKR